MDVALEREREKYEQSQQPSDLPPNTPLSRIAPKSKSHELNVQTQAYSQHDHRQPSSARLSSRKNSPEQQQNRSHRPRSQSPHAYPRHGKHQHHPVHISPKKPSQPSHETSDSKSAAKTWSALEVGRMNKLSQELHHDENMHRTAAKYYYKCAMFLMIPSQIFIAFCGPGTVFSAVASPDCTIGNISIPQLVFGLVSTVASILSAFAVQFKFQKKQRENEDLANKFNQILASILLELKKITHTQSFSVYIETISKKIEKAKKDHESVSVPLHIRTERESAQQTRVSTNV